VSNAFQQATGKLPTFASGSAKWLRLVASGNFFLQQWARERGVDWFSLYDPTYSLGTVTATDTYDLDDEILKLSQQEGDSVRITHGDAHYTDYTIITADRLKDYPTGYFCAKVGRTLKFNRPFIATDSQFSGTITAPVYVYPETFEDDNDDIQIDDPNWLVFVTAADFVRNDVTRKDLRADLVAQANEAMQSMKEDNEAQLSEVRMTWSPSDRTDWY
jgi:hypothetical protein